MLVPPSNVSHNGTNWNDTQTHTQIAFYILIIFLAPEEAGRSCCKPNQMVGVMKIYKQSADNT